MRVRVADQPSAPPGAPLTIDLKRPPPDALWSYRKSVVEEFYAGLPMKTRMIRHGLRRSSSPQDFLAYLTLMGRTYDADSKSVRMGVE
jgi:hypothetical protein